MIRSLLALTALDLAALAGAGSLGWSAAFACAHVTLTLLALRLLARPGLYATAAVTSAAIGPAGPLLFLLLASRRPGESQAHLPAPTPEEPELPAQANDAIDALLSGRLLPAEAARLGSLLSVLRCGDVHDRQRALEVAVRSFEPRLSVIVARALLDPDQAIRALAAAASAQVASNLQQARTRLEARLARRDDPDDRAALRSLLAAHGTHNVLFSDTQRRRLLDDAAGLGQPAGA